MPGLRRGALIDPSGRYRYTLTRLWGDKRRVCWIMLNPSTADAEVDDPTIRRCIGFTKQWDYDGLVVVNLFARRATDPAELERLTLEEAVGGANDATIAEHVHNANLVVAAWGHRGRLHHRHLDVARLCRTFARCPVMCLGLTAHRQPRHPLYVRSTAELVPYHRGVREPV